MYTLHMTVYTYTTMSVYICKGIIFHPYSACLNAPFLPQRPFSIFTDSHTNMKLTAHIILFDLLFYFSHTRHLRCSDAQNHEHTYTHAYVQTLIHTYTYIHTYTHTQCSPVAITTTTRRRPQADVTATARSWPTSSPQNSSSRPPTDSDLDASTSRHSATTCRYAHLIFFSCVLPYYCSFLSCALLCLLLRVCVFF
jgi:hypothetical protein